jgi:hypothetical protein
LGGGHPGVAGSQFHSLSLLWHQRFWIDGMRQND